MRRKLKNLRLGLIILVLLISSGCMRENMEGLLRLPKPSVEYVELQKKIDGILASGASYSAPASGAYRQSVQLYDVDGDGVNEAIAFFSMNSGEKPLKIYIFKIVDGTYENAALIEGEGKGIDSISYTDMDSDGWAEVIVGWKMGSDIQMLKVYKINGFQTASIITTDYTAYTVADLDRNGNQDLLVIRHNRNEFTGMVEAYSISAEGEIVNSGAQLSHGMENITKLSSGTLYDNWPALFVVGNYNGNGLITDIFTYDEGTVKNISALRETGVSSPMYSEYQAFCRDINGDGIMEVPVSSVLPSKNETTYIVLNWYCYNRWGTYKTAVTTHHNYTDSWYLILPPEWRGDGDITLRREDSVIGERAVIFSRWRGEDEPAEDFLTIYTLSGENRFERSTREGRFLLRAEDEVIYAACLSDIGWEYMPDEQYIKSSFFLIYSEWLSGRVTAR